MVLQARFIYGYNPKWGTSKIKPKYIKLITQHNQVGINPEMQRLFYIRKYINVTHYISRSNEEALIIIKEDKKITIKCNIFLLILSPLVK